jgi:hypothetical protein
MNAENGFDLLSEVTVVFRLETELFLKFSNTFLEVLLSLG